MIYQHLFFRKVANIYISHMTIYTENDTESHKKHFNHQFMIQSTPTAPKYISKIRTSSNRHPYPKLRIHSNQRFFDYFYSPPLPVLHF